MMRGQNARFAACQQWHVHQYSVASSSNAVQMMQGRGRLLGIRPAAAGAIMIMAGWWRHVWDRSIASMTAAAAGPIIINSQYIKIRRAAAACRRRPGCMHAWKLRSTGSCRGGRPCSACMLHGLLAAARRSRFRPGAAIRDQETVIQTGVEENLCVWG